MEKDFKLGQSNELIKGDQIYDIHNCFDFESLVLRENDAEIVFRPNPEYGQGSPGIKLDIRNVDYLELSPGFRAAEVTDIDEMGYRQREDRDDRWLQTESQSKGEGDLFFRFQGGHFLRFHGSCASLLEL